MKRTTLTLAAALAVALPANAKVDPTCPTMSSTSAIAGTVEDALGRPVAGMTVEATVAGSSPSSQPAVTTDAAGRYRICAGTETSAGHNFYDVHVRDLTRARLFATVNQPYSTYTNLGDADFTPESDLPLLYATSLQIAPNEISTATGETPVTWLVRSKAPAGTVMMLRLGHVEDAEVAMSYAGAEEAPPEDGGWNRWTHEATFPAGSAEHLWWASARGLDPEARTVLTQVDRQPYTIDNTPPLFGPQGAVVCGPGVTASQFSPGEPGTTNPQPIVTHGACDPHREGSRSGLDPFSLRGSLCTDPYEPSACRDIHPVLNTFTITWIPTEPLARGDHWFRWRIADFAGNASESGPVKLSVMATGGQAPRITGLAPANLGSGNNLGIVIGSSLTTPTAYPVIGFRATDADGPYDIVPGSLRVRIFYLGEQTVYAQGTPVGGLVWEYDVFRDPGSYDPVSKRGGAAFDLSSGSFRATSFPLQGKPPGRYIATASVNDYGGNSDAVTWHWLLAGAS